MSGALCTHHVWRALLGGDYNCTNGQGITLQNGADLDMHGHTLTCVSSVCGNKAGVTMTGDSSVVKNLDAAHEAKILGPFFPSIDCASHTGSKVTGIHFEGQANYGTVNCSKVESNVFLGSQVGNITSSGVSNSDHIGDNYIAISHNTAISLFGNKTTGIDHNLIVLEQLTGTGSAPVGIELSATNSVSATNNIFMGQGGAPFSGTPATVGSNYCEPESTDCQTCIGDGSCDTPVAPFTLP